MENVITTTNEKAITKKKCGIFRRMNYALSAVAAAGMMTAVSAAADFNQTVNLTSNDVEAEDMVGRIIGILLTITRYVGIALVVYGVYEVVMSFMQNQPEAKTKGIVMALAGAVMIGLKTILSNIGVIS